MLHIAQVEEGQRLKTRTSETIAHLAAQRLPGGRLLWEVINRDEYGPDTLDQPGVDVECRDGASEKVRDAISQLAQLLEENALKVGTERRNVTLGAYRKMHPCRDDLDDDDVRAEVDDGVGTEVPPA